MSATKVQDPKRGTPVLLLTRDIRLRHIPTTTSELWTNIGIQIFSDRLNDRFVDAAFGDYGLSLVDVKASFLEARIFLAAMSLLSAATDMSIRTRRIKKDHFRIRN